MPKPRVWPESTCGECGERIPAGYTQACKKGGWCNWHIPAAVRERMEEMAAKLDKIATWLEGNAALKEEFVETCRFESINEEERANAKNYRATAADIRKLLAKADGS